MKQYHHGKNNRPLSVWIAPSTASTVKWMFRAMFGPLRLAQLRV
jgi:hypothetical protein